MISNFNHDLTCLRSFIMAERYNTKKPVPSNTVEDFSDNAQIIDELVHKKSKNILDRFGHPLQTWFGLQSMVSQAASDYGYVILYGESFITGATITNPNQVLLNEGTSEYYKWTGVIPDGGKVVPANSSPQTTGGIGVGLWLAVGDASLRTDLKSSSDGVGDELVSVVQPYAGAISRTQHDKNSEFITAKDFGAFGDGITLDDEAFIRIEVALADMYVDLNGLTYYVSSVFTGNKYGNGYFKRSDGAIVPALYNPTELRAGRYIISVGQEALNSIPESPVGSMATNLIAIGRRAMFNAVNIKNNYAIGYQALYKIQSGVYNTAFGFESLFNNNGNGDSTTGSRNAAFGDNTMRFNTTGYNNSAFGRNAGQTNVTGNNNIHVGVSSGAGDCPVDLNGDIINTFPVDKSNCVGIGTSTLFYTSSSGHAAVGSESLHYLKHGLNNTAFGYLAGKNLEFNVSPTGKEMVAESVVGTYTISNGVIIITQSSHGLSSGDTVKIQFTSGVLHDISTDYIWLPITVAGPNNYTINGPINVNGNGTTKITAKYNTVASDTHCDYNTIIGYNALSTGTKASHSTAIGAGSLISGGQSDNVGVGFRSLVFLGEDGNQIRNTAVGSRAMEYMVDGSECVDVYNSSAIGYQARVSGSSQLQLGNSAVTPYAYAALQIRSDERDKINIKDTELGIDFILGLRPTQGNWNIRDDYIEEYEVQTGYDEQNNPIVETKVRFDEEGYLAGTRARGRDHNWFIAQEVDRLCQSLQIDFAGLQNHSKGGGCDVMSLAYEEFIPPITKALQQCWQRMEQIEKRLEKIESTNTVAS